MLCQNLNFYLKRLLKFKSEFYWVRTEENIEKKWQEYTEELYKKDLHDLNNHDGVITHLEPDILDCEVEWTLGSITMNKASGGDGIPVELFQILKMMLWKWCNHYASKSGKLSKLGKEYVKAVFCHVAYLTYM